MSRLVLAAFAIAALVACKGDNAPTSPVASTSLSDDSWIGGVRGNMAFDQEGNAHSSNVQALVIITHNRGRVRTCNGEDGFYAENHQVNTGTVTGDPRLSGIIEMHILELGHFGDDIHASSFGTFVIRDAASGRKKAEGDYNAWAHFDLLKGTFVGRGLNGAGGQEGGNLIANVRVNFGENGSGTIEIGGASTPESPVKAGNLGGQCTWKFTEYDNVVPPPEAASTAGIRAPSAVAPLWRSFQR